MEKCCPGSFCFGDDSPEAREERIRQNKINDDIKKGNVSI